MAQILLASHHPLPPLSFPSFPHPPLLSIPPLTTPLLSLPNSPSTRVLRHRDVRGGPGRCKAVAGSGGGDGVGGLGGGGGGGGDGDGGTKGGSFLAWYLDALDRHPVLTKSVTSAFLNLVGDLLCQVVINKVSVLDYKRLAVNTFLGFALVGPTLHFWYFTLSKMVTLPGPTGTLLRLFLDQFLFSPTFIGVFISSLVTLEGKPSLVVPKLQQEWVSAVKANWQLWIPFQFLNFQFVPQQFQVLAANIVALAWNVILSFMAHREIVMK